MKTLSRSFLFFLLPFFFLPGSHAEAAWSCSKSCGDSCKIGFLGHNTEPVCFVGCKAWQLKQCYDVSDPYVSMMGEAGSKFYPAASGIMTSRNSIWEPLNPSEKAILKTFYGALVDKVRVHSGANLMDRWGDDPYQIRFGDSAGQTYGHDIYVRYGRAQIPAEERVVLIGHEMCHARQYENRGSSLQKFGRDYFEQFAKKGSYENNPMEVECYGMEDKIRAQSQWFDANKRPWDFQICNQTDFAKIYAAYGMPQASNGFTLVQQPFVKGWYEIPKNQCRTILANQPSEASIDAFVTTGAPGGYSTWGAFHGQKYCVDANHAFENGFRGYDCARHGLESVEFNYIVNPWKQGAGKLATWNIQGRASHLNVCNKSGQVLSAATLLYERGDWHEKGWYVIQAGACSDLNLGTYQGKVYLYAENAAKNTFWQDKTKPGFCVYRGQVFNNEHETTCLKDATIVNGFEINITSGTNTFNLNP